MKVNFYGEEFALLGANFFLLRVDPFFEGGHHPGKQTGSHESCSPCAHTL